MPYDAVVIGGGLAGCSVATQLAERGCDVLLAEQSTYPRHKLCGEFLSHETQASFQKLGVLDKIENTGASSLHSAYLTAPNGRETRHALPEPALGLSRFRLDQLLFEHALSAGVEGRSGTRVTDVSGSLGQGFTVAVGADTVEAHLVFGAYGRRERLDRTLERPFLDETTEYVAFKAHYAGPGVSMVSETVELHGGPNGYCGIAPIENDHVNVCWIGRAKTLRQTGGDPDSMLNESLRENPVLDERLKALDRVSDRFEAVSQIPLMPKSRFAKDVCMIGDAAGMIAPLCGDGMAMALQTADIVTPLAAKFLNGRDSASTFRRTYRKTWTDAFGQRMYLGRWIHQAAFRPGAARLLVNSMRALPPLAQWIIRSTRGQFSTQTSRRPTDSQHVADDR